MEHLLQLRDQLAYVEDFINMFYGSKIIQPTLDRAMKRRHVLIKKIARLQLRYFNHE